MTAGKNTVIIQKQKIPLAGVIALCVFATQSPHAGMLDSLVNAANGALPGYGRESALNNRQALSATEIEEGLREALSVGVDNVLERLSAKNGYANDASVRISLPSSWDRARQITARIGYSNEFDNLEQQLNRTAEKVAPATRDLLQKEISQLAIEDAHALLTASDTQATEFLRQLVSERVEGELRPFVDDSLEQDGALTATNKIAARIKRLVRVSTLDFDLSAHVVSKSLDGFFYYLGKEEKSIRTFPGSRTSELLRKVFG